MTRIVAGSLLAAGISLAAAPQRPAETVLVDTARSIDVVVRKKYVGTVKGAANVSLVPRVSGLLLKQSFQDGGFVKKGQLLFQIEDTTYRAQADAAKAKLAQSEAEYRFAKRNLDRVTTLRSQKAVSESSYDEAVRLEGTTAAAVAAAKAELLDAENNLSYTRILAPFDGIAGDGMFSEQSYVTPASGTLVTVISMEPMKIDFAISSRDYFTLFGSYDNLVKYADIQVELPDGTLYPHHAKVCFMDNHVDKDTDSIMIRGKLTNPDRILIPFNLLTVHLSRNFGKGVGVPPTAVLNNGKMDYVLVVDAKNKVSVRPVTPGEINGSVQIIEKGLQAGETIVIDGTHKAMPGTVINPVRAGEKK